MENCRESGYIVGEKCTVDESVIPFSGRCPIRTYTPGKSVERGVKVFGVADPVTHYYFNGILYQGKKHPLVGNGGLGEEVRFRKKSKQLILDGYESSKRPINERKDCVYR